jgi:hypothetical protein
MTFIKVRSYLSGNSTSSHYKDQLVDAVKKVLAVNSEKKNCMKPINMLWAKCKDTGG